LRRHDHDESVSGGADGHVPKCGTMNKNQVTFCNKCGDPVQLNLKYDVRECQERGMTYAAPLKGHHPPDDFR
jgi:DNA-directed RNA polymerase beta subunit